MCQAILYSYMECAYRLQPAKEFPLGEFQSELVVGMERPSMTLALRILSRADGEILIFPDLLPPPNIT